MIAFTIFCDSFLQFLPLFLRKFRGILCFSGAEDGAFCRVLAENLIKISQSNYGMWLLSLAISIASQQPLASSH
jgi:hypothetical protein